MRERTWISPKIELKIKTPRGKRGGILYDPILSDSLIGWQAKSKAWSVFRKGILNRKRGEKDLRGETQRHKGRGEDETRGWLAGADGSPGLKHEEGECCYCKARVNPVKSRIAFEQEGRGYHGQRND